MSNSVRPHRQQPTRLYCPWNSPGKNAGVGCHFLLQCMKVKSHSEVTQSCLTLSDPMDCSPPGSSVNGIFQARVLEWGAIGDLGLGWYKRGKINQLEHIKIKSFFSGEVSMMKVKKQASDWEKTFANLTFDKGLVFKMYKLSKLNSKKRSKTENRQKTWRDSSKKGIYRWKISLWKNGWHH